MEELINQNRLQPNVEESKLLLEESEGRYKLLVDSVKDYAIFMLNPQGYITTWNPGAERLKGYTKEEILNKHFSIFYTEEALQRNHPQYELEVASKVGRFEEEGWRIKKDGNLFWANVIISAIYDDSNKLIGFSKVTRDLTERKLLEEKLAKANEELKESEERARMLIAGVKDYAIFLLTPEGKIASWNDGARKIKGYEAEEVIGKSFSMFYTPEAKAAKYPQFELVKAMQDGRFEDEGWRVKKDGSKFWANVLITPIYNSLNQHIGFTKITRDLTEKVRNEDLMRKNYELHRVNTDLDNFIYVASHDLKSPISNLEGLLALIERRITPKLDDADKQVIRMMGASIAKLNNTIKSLIEVTKAQKNLEETTGIVSIEEIVNDIKEELNALIAQSNVTIQEQLEVKEIVFAKASLRSVLFNLISNAVKYRSPERKALVEIESYKEEGKTVISIKDNGLGLTKEQEAKLFSMFKRFHNHVDGTGIGLYIVKRTMENNKGKIKVYTKLNEGTEFKLIFNT